MRFPRFHKAFRCIMCLLAFTPSLVAFASPGSLIKQTVSSKSGTDVYKEDHVWRIDAQNFRLDSNSSGRLMSYIFNGKNLYACLKVVEEKFFTSELASAIPPNVKNKLRGGVCLAVPINIATSFLISPHNSVSALDITESLQLTLKLDKYSAKPAGQTIQVANQACSKSARDYQYTYFAYTFNQDLVNGANEQACTSSSINWRKPFWKQLSRTLLQQKQGRAIRKELDDHKIDEMGLDLEKEASYTVGDGKKTLRTIQTQLQTTSIESQDIDGRYFGLPGGYEVIVSAKERTLVADTQEAKPAAAVEKKKEESKDTGVLETIPAILRSFLLIPM